VSKAYIEGQEPDKRYKVHIKLVDCGPHDKAKVEIRTNADEGQLAALPELMAWQHILTVGDVLTIVIED
jgi:hypothetical protein